MPAPIQIEGLREFQRATRKAADTDLPKRLGEAHKEIGRLVIARLRPQPTPQAVGRGAGASIRPSATKREVLLRVGGKHRTDVRQQWGKRQTGPFRAGQRPHIIGTVEAHRDEIMDAYLDAVLKAMKPAFAEVKKA